MSCKPGSGGSITYGPNAGDVRIECPTCGAPRFYQPKAIARLASLNCMHCAGRIKRLTRLAAQGYKIEECCQTCLHYRRRTCTADTTNLHPTTPDAWCSRFAHLMASLSPQGAR